jgi:hypothetical protein
MKPSLGGRQPMRIGLEQRLQLEKTALRIALRKDFSWRRQLMRL